MEKINDIVPKKIIIELEENGKFKDAILSYYTKEESGRVDTRLRTMNVSSQVSVPVISGLILNIKNFVKKKEKCLTN